MTSQNSIEIRGPVEQVYMLAKNVYSFPEFLPDIKQIRILKRSPDGNTIICEWQGVVKEFRAVIKWVTEDTWDDSAHTCKFSVVSGQYFAFSGHWTFTDVGGRTRFDSEIDVDCDLPRIGAPIKSLAVHRLNGNIKHMIKAIKAKVESLEALTHDKPVLASR